MFNKDTLRPLLLKMFNMASLCMITSTSASAMSTVRAAIVASGPCRSCSYRHHRTVAESSRAAHGTIVRNIYINSTADVHLRVSPRPASASVCTAGTWAHPPTGWSKKIGTSFGTRPISTAAIRPSIRLLSVCPMHLWLW